MGIFSTVNGYKLTATLIWPNIYKYRIPPACYQSSRASNLIRVPGTLPVRYEIPIEVETPQWVFLSEPEEICFSCCDHSVSPLVTTQTSWPTEIQVLHNLLKVLLGCRSSLPSSLDHQLTKRMKGTTCMFSTVFLLWYYVHVSPKENMKNNKGHSMSMKP